MSLTPQERARRKMREQLLIIAVCLVAIVGALLIFPHI